MCKRVLLLSLVMVCLAGDICFVNAQEKNKAVTKNDDTHQYFNTRGTKWILWFLPSRARKINGVAFGIVNPCENFDFQSELTINGLSFELIGGLPIVIKNLIFPKMAPFCNENHCRNNGVSAGLSLSTGLLNGIGVTPTVGYINQLNGVFIAPIHIVARKATGLIAGITSRAGKMQGLQIGGITKNNQLKGLQIGIFNKTFDYVQGVQIGLINYTDELHGVQIGLFNIAKDKEHPAIPIFQYKFKNKYNKK